MIHVPTALRALDALAANADDPVDRRLLATALVGYPTWQAVVRAARALDRVAAPGFADQPVRAPVFIVGHPRSGTTLLHRLLAVDPGFCAPRAWELVAPAVTLHRTARAVDHTAWAQDLAERAETALFAPFADTHTTRWSDPEEDDWLLLQAMASPTLEFLTRRPLPSRRWWLGDRLPPATRDRVMRWYRRSVQRILYARAPEATLLSKNPHFTGWIRTLASTFPDARFVMLVRNPAEAIASRLVMLRRAWQRDDTPPARFDPRLDPAFAASCALYRHAELAWAQLPEERRLRVAYTDLVRDPARTVGAVRAHLDLPPTHPALGPAIDAARRRVPTLPARLRQVGIPPRRLDQLLGDLDPLWSFLEAHR